MSATYIKTTQDGRRVEVIDGWICLGGVREAQSLIALADHPNHQAIARALPGAAFVAGRLPLTLVEAGVAQRALTAAQRTFDASPQALAQRMRQAMWARASAEGVE
jgi:hypothetical protein